MRKATTGRSRRQKRAEARFPGVRGGEVEKVEKWRQSALFIST